MKHFILALSLLIVSFTAFAQEQTMYWIGGSGNWNDINHWSFQSGTQGLSKPSSIPTANTHVIFDAGSGLTGTGSEDTRTVFLNGNFSILSLTFDPGLNASGNLNAARLLKLYGKVNTEGSLTVKESVILQAFVKLDFSTIALVQSFNRSLIMDPDMGTTSTITYNGGIISSLIKNNSGTLDINGSVSAGSQFQLNAGVVNYMAQDFSLIVAEFNGGEMNMVNATTANFENGLGVKGTSVVNMPKVLTLSTGDYYTVEGTGNVQTQSGILIDGAATVNLPLCESITAQKDVLIRSSVPFSLPALKKMNIRRFAEGNSNGRLDIAGTAVITAVDWGYAGVLNVGTAEFYIASDGRQDYVYMPSQGSFSTNAGTVIEKIVVRNNPVVSATIKGANIQVKNLISETAGIIINDNMTVGRLTVAPSSVNVIASGKILTITDSYADTTPDCAPLYSFGSSIPGQKGNITNATGSQIIMTNAMLSNINASGAQPIKVTGIDAGNNSPTITFISPESKTLYWVGTAGDNEWNNQANWSAASGGSGGYCLPTMSDDVIFDNNSVITGGTLNITTGSASFRNITVQDNAPVFDFVSSLNMACYGSWYMRSGMTVQVKETQFLSIKPGETITSNGSAFHKVVFYSRNGTGGWIFQDDFKIEDNIINPSQVGQYHLYFRGGTLNTNSKKVYVGGDLYANETNYELDRNLILGNSEFSVNQNWYYNYENYLSPYTVKIDAGTSHIIIRNASIFYGLSSQTYYNVTMLAGGKVSSYVDNSKLTITFNNLYISSLSGVSVESEVVAKEVRIMALNSTIGLKVSLNKVTTAILELPAAAKVSVSRDKMLIIDEELITHNDDCRGFMELYPIGTGTFTIRAKNNVHINNVWMTNVKADLSTGASYTATGIKDEGVTGWIFSGIPAPKDLYWIGLADNQWHNPLNWTINTDGTPSGGCMPTKFDNVHFNRYSEGRIAIVVSGQDAVFNDMITHADAPANINISSQGYVYLNAYGNEFSMGKGMSLPTTYHYGKGTVNMIGAENGSNINVLYLRGGASDQIWNIKNAIRIRQHLVQGNGTLNILHPSLSVGSTLIINGIFNAPSSLSAGVVEFKQGHFNAANTQINCTDFKSIENLPKKLDIRNSNIRVSGYWNYSGTAETELQAKGSRISVSKEFTGLTGHDYETVETVGSGSFAINGGLIINELMMYRSALMKDNNTIGKLIMMPRGITLSLSDNTTQTITGDMVLNGSPCSFNYLKAVSATGASIAYANPDNHNRFDFVQVGGIVATNANLEFNVNSSDLGNNNNKVIFLQGTPGLVGLGADFTCKVIDQNNAASYTISAKEFYGNPTSTYIWFKKDARGVFQNLNVPNNTVSIDVRKYGLDGVYRVDMVYDPSGTTQCPRTDEITVSYSPILVGIEPGQDNLLFCEDAGKQVSDLTVDQVTKDFIAVYGTVLNWYTTATGGTALSGNSSLVNGNYYASLTTKNNCESPGRVLVKVAITQKPVANAGPDQTLNNKNVFTMAANNPQTDTGVWKIISGNITIVNPLAFNTEVTIISGDKAELQWTVSNAACSPATDNVMLTIQRAIPRVNPGIRIRVSQ